jgi:hypothetical protein
LLLFNRKVNESAEKHFHPCLFNFYSRSLKALENHSQFPDLLFERLKKIEYKKVGLIDGTEAFSRQLLKSSNQNFRKDMFLFSGIYNKM